MTPAPEEQAVPKPCPTVKCETCGRRPSMRLGHYVEEHDGGSVEVETDECPDPIHDRADQLAGLMQTDLLQRDHELRVDRRCLAFAKKLADDLADGIRGLHEEADMRVKEFEAITLDRADALAGAAPRHKCPHGVETSEVMRCGLCEEEAKAAPGAVETPLVDEHGFLPCPFCGGAAHFEGYAVKCDGECFDMKLWIDSDDANEERCRAAWNRRARLSALKASAPPSAERILTQATDGEACRQEIVDRAFAYGGGQADLYEWIGSDALRAILRKHFPAVPSSGGAAVVRLPERETTRFQGDVEALSQLKGWKLALDEVTRLNPAPSTASEAKR